jgi:hypothetical protein
MIQNIWYPDQRHNSLPKIQNVEKAEYKSNDPKIGIGITPLTHRELCRFKKQHMETVKKEEARLHSKSPK